MDGVTGEGTPLTGGGFGERHFAVVKNRSANAADLQISARIVECNAVAGESAALPLKIGTIQNGPAGEQAVDAGNAGHIKAEGVPRRDRECTVVAKAGGASGGPAFAGFGDGVLGIAVADESRGEYKEEDAC